MTADPQDIIKRLWYYGHFHSPEIAHNVTKNDLKQLTLDDQVVKLATLSYQKFFKDELDERALRIHQRAEIVPDGDIGPATIEQLWQPRCGVPEFANAEEANWPTSCRGSLTFAYQMSLRGLDAAALRKLVLEMTRNWGGALTDLKIALIDDLAKAKIWAKGKSLPGSTLAWSFLANNNCGSRLEQAYDTSISWSERLFLTTCSHEVGHAIGLEHVNDRNALMYPSINAAAESRRGFPNATDLAQCKRIGYNVAANPAPLPDGQTPPPTPSPTDGFGFIGIDNQIYELSVKRKIL